MFTPFAPAGVVLGYIKLGIDVVNTASTLLLLKHFEEVIRRALINHDKTLQNTRFSDFRQDYQILKFYLSADDLHFAKIKDLKVNQHKGSLYVNGVTGGVFGIASFGVGSKVGTGFYRAARFPANATGLDAFDFCRIGCVIGSIVDCFNLHYAKKSKDEDFKLYDKHIESLALTKKYHDDLIAWCEENFSQENLDQLDAEFKKLAVDHAKDTSVDETMAFLTDMRKLEGQQAQESLNKVEEKVEEKIENKIPIN